jgi:preprotein translocase subunit SecB
MAENDQLPDAGDPQANGADTGPALGLIAQYVKDLSFENPLAPGIYQTTSQPQIDVNFNIGTQAVADAIHEVAMKIEITAKVEQGTAFAVELVYAGLFAARNIPDDQLRPFLLAQAPALLFPFARRVVAEAVRDGNFPPLLLDPIDFGAMYLAQEQAGDLATAEPAGQA